MAELDKQTALMNQKIMEQRKKMGGINAARENNQQIQKQIKVLENRLEKALVKYNEAIAHNKKLRGRIDNLRRERLVYDQIHKKLEKELESKKEEMKGIVEISEAAYESRENALAEMTQLKQQADQEQSLFESEWKDLGKLLDHDRRMKDFTKGVNREAEEKRASFFPLGPLGLAGNLWGWASVPYWVHSPVCLLGLSMMRFERR